MVTSGSNTKFFYDSPSNWVFFGLTAVTLYFQTNLADPFNSPKMWILMAVSAWLIGYIYTNKNLLYGIQEIKVATNVGAFFLLSLLFASLITDFQYAAFFGDVQRRNGFFSYLALVVLFIASTIFINVQNIRKLYYFTFFISISTLSYGILQTTGRDFVDWINPHNALIGTQGNPNFAAAVMAIMSTLLFSSIFVSSFPTYQKLAAITLTILILVLIIRSNARQGLISFFLGCTAVLLVWAYSKRVIVGVLISFPIFCISLLGILGILQIGPLEKYLYKGSVSVRGYYWQAGIEMFKDNFFTGIGSDRYGAYFMQYREVDYPLRYGFELTSSNAHNTFIQFFATGGLFLGVAYITLQVCVLFNVIKGLKNSNGNIRMLLAGLFGSWVAFHAQSLVSIDNLGVSIWGWVLGGSIIGVSNSISSQTGVNKVNSVRKSQINLKRVFISTGVLIPVAVLISVLYRGENNAFKASIPYQAFAPNARDAYKQLQLNGINATLVDPNYSIKMANNLIQSGYVLEGIEALKEVHELDPRNLDTVNLLSTTYEAYQQPDQAIIYREKMVRLNPWNAVNYLLLGQDYKKVGNLEKSQEMLEKILSFASGVNGGPIAEQAKKDLAQ
jgi:O-antigen ligase